MTVSPEIYPSISVAVRKIYKDSGIGGLYAGISPTLVGMLPYSTCIYFMYETMKKSYCLSKKKESLSRAEMLLIGALSGENLGVDYVVLRFNFFSNFFPWRAKDVCLTLFLKLLIRKYINIFSKNS